MAIEMSKSDKEIKAYIDKEISKIREEIKINTHEYKKMRYIISSAKRYLEDDTNRFHKEFKDSMNELFNQNLE